MERQRLSKEFHPSSISFNHFPFAIFFFFSFTFTKLSIILHLLFDRGTFVATFFTRTNPIDFFFFFYPKITKLFAFLEYLSSRSLQGPDSLAILWAHRVGVEWLDARPPRFLPPCPHLPGQSPCNSCALRCRLGIVDRPRPPSIMSLMYVVFSPISPPCPFLFSLVSLTLSLSLLYPLS